MNLSILTVEIRYEQDVVLARQRSRQIAERLSFDARDQTRIATAVSEIARNAFQYGGGGRVEFQLDLQLPQRLVIDVRDQGQGIPQLQAILEGQYHSATGMGRGIIGTQRLMDEFEVVSVNGRGTTVTLRRLLPRRAPLQTAASVAQIAEELGQRSPQNPYEEIQQQNQELLRALEELRKREDELSQLNRELEDTNRGVVALYAELDEKAASLQRANEIKTRFLSNMSHEFRTPVNSILSLTGLLLNRLDGDLTPEQEKQVNFICKAAESLSDLVNDLLDLAKVEAGKIDIRPTPFEINDLFATLRGMFRPLTLGNPAVILTFQDPPSLPLLHTDEGKVAQILRNFISNALKFTEQGEVRVSASQQGNTIHFAVSDTGIGIASQDLCRIFEDFVQLNAHHHRFKGTGLGLPLSRKLAELLGGSVSVQSQPGQGSTFVAIVPIVYNTPQESSREEATEQQKPPTHRPCLPEKQPQQPLFPNPPPPKLLLIDDDPTAHYLMQQTLAPSAIALLSATSGVAGLQLAASDRPGAIVLDLAMPEMTGFEVLEQLRQQPQTRDIPVIIKTSWILSPAERQQLTHPVIALLSKHDSLTGIDQALLKILSQLNFAVAIAPGNVPPPRSVSQDETQQLGDSNPGEPP